MTKEEIIEECKQRLGFETDYEMYTLCRHEKDFYNAIIKALEQQHNDDVMAIHTQGLAEGIRCAMCTNTMKSDRGCDGGCVVDEDMYKKVMETINNQMFSQPTSDDCVSRQAVIEYIEACGAELGHDLENESVREDILNMPPVTSIHGTCKNCRWLTTDEDGNYYCKQTWDFDSLDFYCKDFEKRGDENESID